MLKQIKRFHSNLQSLESRAGQDGTGLHFLLTVSSVSQGSPATKTSGLPSRSRSPRGSAGGGSGIAPAPSVPNGLSQAGRHRCDTCWLLGGGTRQPAPGGWSEAGGRAEGARRGALAGAGGPSPSSRVGARLWGQHGAGISARGSGCSAPPARLPLLYFSSSSSAAAPLPGEVGVMWLAPREGCPGPQRQ